MTRLPPDSQAAQISTTQAQSFLPNISVDCTVFGFHGGALRILLVQWKGLHRWSLPGGFVRQDEPVDRAAERVLRERTTLDRIYLEQFHAFGDADRGEEVLYDFAAADWRPGAVERWMAERVVSIGYVALVDYAETSPIPDEYSEECRWWEVDQRPPLLMDHDRMVALALRTLRASSCYLPLGANLLPERFTMPELQRLHEAVLGRSLDRRNFQRQMLMTGLVERLPERRTGGTHRAPYLYRFRASATDP